MRYVMFIMLNLWTEKISTAQDSFYFMIPNGHVLGFFLNQDPSFFYMYMYICIDISFLIKSKTKQIEPKNH